MEFSLLDAVAPSADARNSAGGIAFAHPAKAALAQLAATGVLKGTFYTTGDGQIDAVRKLVAQIDDAGFLARLAVYARRKAFMKDMPAVLLLELSRRDPALFRRVFPKVVDNGRMLRTVFTHLRSGAFGRRGMSSAIQKAFASWFNTASVPTLIAASIGNDPTLRDVLRMARPTPADDTRRALFGRLAERAAEKWAPATENDLPREIRDLDAFRAASTEEEQATLLESSRLRWDLLADTAKGATTWMAIARHMGPQALRMNLNTLHRHGVFDNKEMVAHVARRLCDADEIRRGRQFPYQYLAAFMNADNALPGEVRSALNTAAELACGNVPELPGPVLIGVDVSGSMGSPVTGYTPGRHASKMRCVDVAALFGAAILRRNPGSVVVPFNHGAVNFEPRPSWTLLEMTRNLGNLLNGGTDCSVALKEANGSLKDRAFAGVVLISDNESWIGEGRWGATGVMEQWGRYGAMCAAKGRVAPKLVCIDLVPNTTTQAPNRFDVLNVGGFSDAVFEVVNAFLRDDGATFVREVEATEV